MFKRAIWGHVPYIGKGYTLQYRNEVNFKYNSRRLSDAERVDRAIKASEAKWPTMREPKSASA